MPNPNEVMDVEAPLDLHSEAALVLAGAFKTMMEGTKTSFPDISGKDMWDKLYYAGVIPAIIRFIHSENQVASAQQNAALLRSLRDKKEYMIAGNGSSGQDYYDTEAIPASILEAKLKEIEHGYQVSHKEE